MGYEVKILADSIGPNGKRLTTWQLTYPRFVHAELMTHRLFSRNSASSRAIPTKKLMRQIRKDPAMPVWWGKNQGGMQARQELRGLQKVLVKFVWLQARWVALLVAWAMSALGFHKQIANRVLEPWMFITVIVSATEFENWFKLRCHPDAQPEIGWVAKEMKRQYDLSTPRDVQDGSWHLPLIDPTTRDDIWFEAIVKYAQDPNAQGGVHFDRQNYVNDRLRKISVARCARVSYLTHDGRRDYQEDLELHDKLASSGHWSPFEHVAQAQQSSAKRWSGNFHGWGQYRELIDPTFTRVGH